MKYEQRVEVTAALASERAVWDVRRQAIVWSDGRADLPMQASEAIVLYGMALRELARA